VARLFLFDVLSGVPLTIWYDWRDDGTEPTNQEHHFGLVRNAYLPGAAQVYDPKPAYAAAQTYARALAGYRFKERAKTDSDDDYVLSFAQGAKSCLVAWTAAPTPHEVKIPAPNGTYDVTSYDGKVQTTAQAVNGAITLTLDDGPQYLKSR
jgi:hypothetical protein